MDGFGEVLAALGGWVNVGAGTLLVLVVAAILRGLLVPRGLVPREEMVLAVEAVQKVADARVTDALARVEDFRARAVQAEGAADKWRDAWITSESGRRLAAEQTVGVLTATTPVAQILTAEAMQAARNMSTSRQT